MNTTREQKKSKALELMKTLDIYKPYIKAFKDNDTVCVFENFGGYYIDKDSKLYNEIKNFEEENDCLVYAVTHEYTDFGECYDFLFVSDYEEEWEYIISYSDQNRHVILSYVLNNDMPDCSEFGDITIQTFGGGVRRIA